MPRRFQKLIFLLLTLVFLFSAIMLVLFNVKNNIVFFFTPTELIEEKILYKNKIRIGGLVKENSIKYNTNTNKINFYITDNQNEIEVNYVGILPDLFKEGSGVVVEGKLKNNLLNAKRVFAKHDENYMPKNIAEQIKKSGNWKKLYK